MLPDLPTFRVVKSVRGAREEGKNKLILSLFSVFFLFDGIKLTRFSTICRVNVHAFTFFSLSFTASLSLSPILMESMRPPRGDEEQKERERAGERGNPSVVRGPGPCPLPPHYPLQKSSPLPPSFSASVSALTYSNNVCFTGQISCKGEVFLCVCVFVGVGNRGSLRLNVITFRCYINIKNSCNAVGQNINIYQCVRRLEVNFTV